MSKLQFLLMFATISFLSSSMIAQDKELTFESVFNENALNKVEINIDIADWRQALEITHTSIDATIRINGESGVSAKIARKGNTSNVNTRDRDKIPFKVDGPKSFNFKLNNNYLDYTMGAREYIGYKMHQEFTGIGSSIAASEVYINGEFYGLYLAVEDLNRKFYEENVGIITSRVKASPTDTSLVGGASCGNLLWLGEKAEYYEGRYEIKKGPVDDLIELIDVINNDPDEAYKHIDIEQVCRFLAVENYLMNIDGIIGEVYSHNYELVKRGSDSIWQVIPWDLNLCLGGLSNHYITPGDNVIETMTQIPPTLGMRNNSLIGLIMEKYFFLYHYYYSELIEDFDDAKLVSWAQRYGQIIESSVHEDNKLYDNGLIEKAYYEDLETDDGYLPALIPTIKKRYAYLKNLSLDRKFANKITQVEQHQDSVFISLAPEVRKETVVIEYLSKDNKCKKLRANPRSDGVRGHYGILPEEAVSYYVFTVYHGIKYNFPYNGLMGMFNAIPEVAP